MRDEPSEALRMMGLALHRQGQLDMAYDCFCSVPLAPTVMQNLYDLGLDMERRGHLQRARAVYAHMACCDPNYLDIAERRALLLEPPTLEGAYEAADRPSASMASGASAVYLPVLSRYRLETELGKGAMGVVYRGQDRELGRSVAIKTLALGKDFEGEALAEARDRFFREAETAGRLQHQNIVKIFDAAEEQGIAYIAMEFLEGGDLTTFCSGANLLPVAHVLTIGALVADALDYAHRNRVVHRDIKPANIIYNPATGAVKVTDFGIARITDSNKTRTGLVLGTPSFMSPEQLSGARIDGRSDLYSLGVTLFQLLAGTLPFRAESIHALMGKIANELPPNLNTRRRGLPPEVAGLVSIALEKRAENRFQTGADMAEALRAVLHPGAAHLKHEASQNRSE